MGYSPVQFCPGRAALALLRIGRDRTGWHGSPPILCITSYLMPKMPKKRRRTASLPARDESERAWRRSAAWLAGEKEAFQAAMDGAALETSLGILIRTAIQQAKDNRRCAFFRVSHNGIDLQHVVGMGDAYARHVDSSKLVRI